MESVHILIRWTHFVLNLGQIERAGRLLSYSLYAFCGCCRSADLPIAERGFLMGLMGDGSSVYISCCRNIPIMSSYCQAT